ncbi:MAG: hypothetical protein VYC39_10275 [Myxococcota bacterium]|nr:hypothetical protein [Myxococcota bacterium]
MSVSLEDLCVKNELTKKGQIAIGKAKWTELKQGSFEASVDEPLGKWISSKTTPKKEAARTFEAIELAGEPLATVSMEHDRGYRIRATSHTKSTFKFINADGRDVTRRQL